MDVKPAFLTQIDGNAEITKERYTEMKDAIAAENPDIVITHWPIDPHADHRVCASLAYDAWRRLGYTFELYYFEAMTGLQSQGFHPTDYVDITDFFETKMKMLNCMESQKAWMADNYASLRDDQERFFDTIRIMSEFRGMQAGCKYAEGFVRALDGMRTRFTERVLP